MTGGEGDDLPSSTTLLLGYIRYGGTSVSVNDRELELVRLDGGGGNDVFDTEPTTQEMWDLELIGGEGDDDFTVRNAPWDPIGVTGGRVPTCSTTTEPRPPTSSPSRPTPSPHPGFYRTVVTPFSGIERLDVYTGAGTDTVNAVGVANMPLLLDGGGDAGQVDTLNVDAQQGRRATTAGPDNGIINVAGEATPIGYTGFEAVNVLNDGTPGPSGRRPRCGPSPTRTYATARTPGRNSGSATELVVKRSATTGNTPARPTCGSRSVSSRAHTAAKLPVFAQRELVHAGRAGRRVRHGAAGVVRGQG